MVLGILDKDAGQYVAAEQRFNQALECLVAARADSAASTTRYHLGVVAFGREDPDEPGRALAAALPSRRDQWGATAGYILHLRGLEPVMDLRRRSRVIEGSRGHERPGDESFWHAESSPHALRPSIIGE